MNTTTDDAMTPVDVRPLLCVIILLADIVARFPRWPPTLLGVHRVPGLANMLAGSTGVQLLTKRRLHVSITR
jgi:hypothetical protein